ncbi:protein kinase domain-containing protein [Nonlabens xiamenensis]|uniref:protein kinase domain-containing protein n=1 Tax=Nonlabens xiamenensis TaxID=2341043 RepID=UPI000F60E8B5|nr:AAA domain-containing protein [Nonlabens xiamenensis]
MKFVRVCPSCGSQRPVHEMYCQSQMEDQACGWLLMNVRQTPVGGNVEINIENQRDQRYCENGHEVGSDDFMCMECGADIRDGSSVEVQEVIPQKIDTYTVLENIQNSNATKECFLVQNDQEQVYFLTLYHKDFEPDTAIYQVLQKSDTDHVAELIHTGQWEDRFYEVTERITGGSIAESNYLEEERIEKLVDEIGRALRDLSEAGIRHRDLSPDNILIREKESFDLVLIDFSSARLSDYDLDTDTPLELTRYTAPEAIIGAVSPSSDWWSLGMIVLEQVTKGSFFQDVNNKAFMIHLVTRGVQLPTEIDERFLLLLQGLLCRDPLKRWNWNQVEKWLNNEPLDPPDEFNSSDQQKYGKSIKLGDEIHTNPSFYALSAAEETHWKDGLEAFTSGSLSSWLEEIIPDEKLKSRIRHLRNMEDVDLEWRFSLALMLLNESLPLTWRGQIIIPAWLLSNTETATQLIEGKIPAYLEEIDREKWLVHLKYRKQNITKKAASLEIQLNANRFKLNSLSTSRVRLNAEIELLRQLYPDANNISLSDLMADLRPSEEDLILILSAKRNQLISLEKLVNDTVNLARRNDINVNPNFYKEFLIKSRLKIYDLLTRHLEGFSKSQNHALNRWADQFRIEKRLSLIQSVLCLSLPKEEWITPPKHEYATRLLRFYEKKIVHASSRGPLVRLILSTNSARLDITELGTALKPAEKFLQPIICRTSKTETVDPIAFSEHPLLERRTRRMLLKAANFKRDTGLDSLYLGFPFLISPGNSNKRPRILPILLWPVDLELKNRRQPRLDIGFDKYNNEVRINPALSSVFDDESLNRIKKICSEILATQSLTIQEIMDALGSFITPKNTSLTSHPTVSYQLSEPGLELYCSAVFFNANFTGQAISEDLRRLQSLAHSDTAMEALLKIREPEISTFQDKIKEVDRYTVVAVDPSQEKAVLQSRLNPGIVIEGPPGTGKSQTIVNIIADCIGRQEKVLVVSQKRAAIQVILKRLEATGLDQRAIAITDINKDRQTTIQSVREQVPGFMEKIQYQNVLRGIDIERTSLAKQIDRIESSLNVLAEEIHVVDDLSGSTYRNILSELIGLQTFAYIDVPEARRFLEVKDIDELNTLIQQSKSLIQLWLPSHYETSTLHNLKLAQIDQSTKEAIGNDLKHFFEAEEKRIDCLKKTSNAFDGTQAQYYGSWLEENARPIKNTSENVIINVQSWFDLLYDDYNTSSIAQDISEKLEAIYRRVGELIADFQFDYFSESLHTIDDKTLQKLANSCDYCLSTSFLKYLNPFGFLHMLRVKRFLQPLQIKAIPETLKEFKIALEQERSFRKYRFQFFRQLERLKITKKDINDPKYLRLKIGSTNSELQEAIQMVNRIKACPLKDEAKNLLKTGSILQYQEFVARLHDAHDRYKSRLFSQEVLRPLTKWLQPNVAEDFSENIRRNESDVDILEQMLHDMEHYIQFQTFRMRLGTQGEYDSLLRFFSHLRKYEHKINEFPSQEWSSLIQNTIRREGLLGWKHRIEQASPTLLMSEQEIQLNVETLEDLLEKIRTLNRRFLDRSIEVDKLGSQTEWNRITRLRGKNYKKLREFISLGIDIGLIDMRPVWLMSPEVVSQAIPLQSGLFDVVIFDEASQMLIDHSIPALYRAKRVIVSGDEKQMPPTGFFSQKMDDENEETQELRLSEDHSEEELANYQDAWNRREVKDCPDLLSLAKSTLPVTTLEIHYRSQFQSLIKFSNHAFYGGKLHVPAYHPKQEIINKKPLEVLRIDGVYDEQTNEKEADALINYIAQHWQQPESERFSAGIVTFNKKQAELIEDKIHEREMQDEAFRSVLNQERNRQQEGEDMGFFVKNVENVQGDERDMILFSTTFGLNQHGVFRRNFGALGHRGGERRLNVAITRARFKVVIATSMPIKDISDILSTGRPPSKPRDFIQAYLNYSEIHSNGQVDVATATVSKLSAQNSTTDALSKNDGFKNTVKFYIESLGYQVVENNDYNVFYLDLAIEKNGRFVLGIECDTPRNMLLKAARYREIWRIQVLKKTIPLIHRTTSYRWLKEPEKEQNRLKEAIELALMNNP